MFCKHIVFFFLLSFWQHHKVWYTEDRTNHELYLTDVHGIIVQLPLMSDNALDEDVVTDSILPTKDVDGLHNQNAGKLSRGEMDGDLFIPCTPRGCLSLIQYTGIKVIV